MIRSVILFCVVSIVSVGATADDAYLELESELELLAALHEVREMWLDPRIADWEVSRRVDEWIDRWRGPNPDGSYDWIIRERPSSEVVDKSEHLVYGTENRKARVEDGDSWVYGVRIVVPRKRSLFRGNHAVWVEEIAIRTQAEDGAMAEDVIDVQRWFEPNSTQTWDLEAIVARADVALEVATSPDHRGEALVEIHFLESVERDDPAGPHFAAIRTMQEIDSWLTAERIDRAIERTEGRLFPGVYSIPLATVTELLESVLTRMDSEDPEEQKKARAALVDALRLIREP